MIIAFPQRYLGKADVPYAPAFFMADKASALEYAQMLVNGRQGNAEPLSKPADGCLAMGQLLQHPAPRRIP